MTGTTATVYANTEQGLGFKRQAEFWWNIGPIVFDYWWNSYPNSPKVMIQQHAAAAAHTTTTVLNTASDDNEVVHETEVLRNAQKRKELLTTLHERNAPKLFETMLHLGGLYIKLGQVLSVTVLPIPEQYRKLFRTLQSNVPGVSDFESVVKPTLEKELGASLDTIFTSVDPIPCGSASIGQAHRATLRESNEEVIIKVQYPSARWQIPADIECVGDFLHLCVQFGIVDESSSTMSYEEFARQFMAELDYERETENLKLVYQSSLDPQSPYMTRGVGVLIPRVFDKYCTKQVITMTYLPGPKFEEFAKKQLAFLGIDPERGVRSVVMEGSSSRHHGFNNSTMNTEDRLSGIVVEKEHLALSPESSSFHWKMKLSRFIGNFVSVDSMLSLVRFAKRIVLWSTVVTVKSIQTASTFSMVPTDWKEWANEQEHSLLQAERYDWIQESVSTLIDVHGYQILNQGLFSEYCIHELCEPYLTTGIMPLIDSFIFIVQLYVVMQTQIVTRAISSSYKMRRMHHRQSLD